MYSKEYYFKNKEKIKAEKRRQYAEGKYKYKEARRKYREEHKEAARKYKKEHHENKVKQRKSDVQNITNEYVKKKIANNYKIKYTSIPKELIDSYRLQILTKRLLKQKCNENIKTNQSEISLSFMG